MTQSYKTPYYDKYLGSENRYLSSRSNFSIDYVPRKIEQVSQYPPVVNFWKDYVYDPNSAEYSRESQTERYKGVNISRDYLYENSYSCYKDYNQSVDHKKDKRPRDVYDNDKNHIYEKTNKVREEESKLRYKRSYLPASEHFKERSYKDDHSYRGADYDYIPYINKSDNSEKFIPKARKNSDYYEEPKKKLSRNNNFSPQHGNFYKTADWKNNRVHEYKYNDSKSGFDRDHKETKTYIKVKKTEKEPIYLIGGSQITLCERFASLSKKVVVNRTDSSLINLSKVNKNNLSKKKNNKLNKNSIKNFNKGSNLKKSGTKKINNNNNYLVNKKEKNTATFRDPIKISKNKSAVKKNKEKFSLNSEVEKTSKLNVFERLDKNLNERSTVLSRLSVASSDSIL